MFRPGRILAAVVSAAGLLVSGPAGHSVGEPGYLFSCERGSLTADFASRDALPQSVEPVSGWYETNSRGRYLNGGWGPRANVFPPPAIPADTGCDPITWKRERVIAVAMRYTNTPDNPLGLQYRHHHVPGWAPQDSTYPGTNGQNADVDDPQDRPAWAAGPGLDCSNYTAWVYNYGLGIKFSGDVHRQADGTAGPMGSWIPASGPFEPGDLIFLHPNGNADVASHVAIYLDDQHVIDSRVSAQNALGVQIRNRVGWYRDATLGAWRPIG